MTLLELLLAGLLLVSGVERQADPSLAPLAERRAAAITTDFSHAGLETPEVLAWSTDTLEGFLPRVPALWWASDPHRAVLGDASLTRVWCAWAPGVSPDDGETPAWFVACVLDRGPAVGPAPGPAPPAPTAPGDPVVPLPDTSSYSQDQVEALLVAATVLVAVQTFMAVLFVVQAAGGASCRWCEHCRRREREDAERAGRGD